MSADGFFHCSVKSVGRSNGRSIVAAAAYRSGTRIEDERTGEVFDFRARGGVLDSFIIAPANAPSWAADRGRLWNGAESAETRANGRLATEVELGLPYELSSRMRKALVTEFARTIAEKHGVAVDVALHKPSGKGIDHKNYHAHVVVNSSHAGRGWFCREGQGTAEGYRAVGLCERQSCCCRDP